MDWLGKATVDSLHTLGDIYVSENLMDLAARAYERAIDVDARQPSPGRCEPRRLLAARGATAPARQVAAHIRRAWGEQLEEADRRRLLKLEARLSMADGSGSADTASVLEEIVKLDPLDGEALLLLGQHYSRQNEPDRAILYYERAESLAAFEVNARIRHAQVLVGRAARTAGAALAPRAGDQTARRHRALPGASRAHRAAQLAAH
ncbi:MAG: tetratricopeptide repeat protein [Planctomycetota bacterium]